MLQVLDCKTEYRKTPLGLDAVNPRFSWKLKSAQSGVIQKSYRIVSESEDGLLWDSGVILSEDSQRVRYQGKKLSSRQRVYWWVMVTTVDENGVEESVQSETTWFEMGLINCSNWQCKWIEPEFEVDNEVRKPAPYLRKVFGVRPGLKMARIYQTAHGLYELWLNGRLGTEEKFKPGLTSYYYRIQYQVFDITNHLHIGENVWAVVLGDGWWRGSNNFGYKLHYYGQIELTYEDGSREIIPTDEFFKHATGGLLATDMKQGEIYDATIEPKDWKIAEFDDSAWSFVHLTDEHADATLIASRSEPVREKECFRAQPFKDNDDKLVLDFGQNIAGYVHMKIHGCEKGQQVHLIHGEMLNDGSFSIANVHTNPLEKHDFQCITYRCLGLPTEEYTPQFAIFGFRYVLVEGYEGSICPDDFIATAVYSDLEETGDFICSNPLINKLVQNSRWSQKGNFMDVAVDCPTRERNAWTGDSQIYVRTACNFMNVYSFFEKWMQDQSIEQYASGKVGITFPSTSSVHNPEELLSVQKQNPMAALAGPTGDGNIGEDCAGWGDSTAWIPYIIYLCYGDKQILINQFNTAKKWVDYMLKCAKEHNPLYEDQPQYQSYTDGELDADYIYDTRMHYGEWMEPIPKESTKESLAEIFMRMEKEGKPKVATAYMCRSAENVAHMAKILGNKIDNIKYSEIADKIRYIYDKYLIGKDGIIEPGHQAAYVRALAMNLCSEIKRPLVEEQLVKEIEDNNYCLNTGFLSTPFLLPVLVDMGRTDLAFRILEQTLNPSWLHPILMGATTIPESWDGFDTKKDSLNHYSYGAVCEFLFSRVAGIKPKFEAPGYKQFALCPIVGGSLTHAEATYESLYGTIVSGWRKKEQGLEYYCTVPVNTSANLTLPNGKEHLLKSGDYRFYISGNYGKSN